MIDANVTFNRATPKSANHFFGYYDKCPWSGDGSKLLALETAFIDRSPEPDEGAGVLVVDANDPEKAERIDTSYSWCWQMGAILQWMPDDPNRTVMYNTRIGDRFVAVVHNIETGAKRVLPRPVYALGRDGKKAISVNFGRIHEQRPGYGYPGVPDQWADEHAPAADGLYLMDMTTGEHRLVLSYADIAACEPVPEMAGKKQWVNHIYFGPGDERIVFLHRFRLDDGGCVTRMMTADPDGKNLACVGASWMISHYDWQQPGKILAWCDPVWTKVDRPQELTGASLTKPNDFGDADYYNISDPDGAVENVGHDLFPGDGHCSWSPDLTWIVTDTYPDKDKNRTLFIYRPSDRTVIDLGKVYAPPELPGDRRCDLHPRWSRDGKRICFDSAHEGDRQMYTVDVSEFVRT